MAEPSDVVDVDKEVKEIKGFEQFKLDKWLLKQLQSLGLIVPTPVQLNCIPEILNGKDCIACAQTGTGKTLAFALPIIQDLSVDPYGIFALILTPTRELAVQIADQFKIIGKTIGIKVSTIIGGFSIVDQSKQLETRPHIVVGTPGRILDILTSFSDLFNFSKMRYLVLDEADQLLSGSFNEQMKGVFSFLPSKRRTLLFSATITDALDVCMNVAGDKPFFYEAEMDIKTVRELDQRYVLAPKDFKDAYLVNVVYHFVQEFPKRSVVVFTESCESCEVLVMMFHRLQFKCLAIHSMISQKYRLKAITQFKSSAVKILIATDVASRGLDIPKVDLVINHNVPVLAKDYVHRVGRTARAGREGMAITFLMPRDINLIYSIEELINTKLKEFKVDDQEVLDILVEVNVTKRACHVQVDQSDFKERQEFRKKKKLIWQGLDPEVEELKKTMVMDAIRKKKSKKHEKEED